jgi:hypothetical protein
MKFKYIIISLLIINLYGFEGIKFYKNGEYHKAEESFSKYAKETNSTVAKAFLAKIYYKEGEYKKSKKIINELLNNNSVPNEVKKELKNYFIIMKGKTRFNAAVSASILYDSNINYDDKDKKAGTAYVTELIGQGSYLKNSLKTSINFKFQNREYFRLKKNEFKNYNYLYINNQTYLYTDIYLTYYYSLINTRFKIGYNGETTKDNHLYESELYFFKQFNHYKTGLFISRDYYKNNNLNSKNWGGGLRAGFLKNNFKTKLSLISYYDDFTDKELDNKNYKIDIEANLNFSKFYLFINYYYDLDKFHNYIKHIHYLNSSFNIKSTKHIDYSIGITDYYSLIHSSDNDIKKYEIYAKLIYNF